jgi:hypothetical protein
MCGKNTLVRLGYVAAAAISLLVWQRSTAAIGGSSAKLTAEELVRYHLSSIGTEEARAARRTIVLRGKCNLLVMAGKERMLSGDASFMSAGKNFRSSLRFPVSDYPAEELSFDGKTAYVGLLNPGQRSRIGEFLYAHDAPIREGLVGGVLSLGWPLLECESRKPRLKYTGIRTKYDQRLHELEYRMTGSGREFKVSLYFEQNSYHHVATVYKFEVPDAPAMVPDLTNTGASRAADSPRRIRSLYMLEERFGDFQSASGLTLPFRWKLRLTTESQAAAETYREPMQNREVNMIPEAASRDLSIVEWDVSFEEASFNRAIDPQVFALY